MWRIRLFLFLSAISLPTRIYSQDLYNGLIACYSFSGNANDGSGNQNNGTVNGATLTSDRFGNANSAYYFNGTTSNYINIPSAPFKNNYFSYSAWANASSIPVPGDYGTVISIGDDVTARHQAIGLGNSYATAQFVGWGGGGWNTGATLNSNITVGALPNINQWYHLVLTKNSTTMKFYLNGQLIGTSPTDGEAFYGSSTTANIGVRCTYIQPFNGKIDDFSIYNREITQEEVTMLYQNGLTCSPAVVPPPPTANGSTFCGSGVAVLTASGGTTYRWYDADVGGNLLFQGNPFTTPPLSISTDYYVSNFQNNLESQRVKVTVTILSVPELTCNLPTDIIIGSEASISTSVISGTSPFKYIYDFGDGSQLTSTRPEADYQYPNGGSYLVSVSVIDANQCSNTCLKNITVFGNLFVPNVLTVNNDTLNEKLTIFVKNGNNYTTYFGTAAFQMKVFNRWGEEIYHTVDASEGWRGQNVDEGIYYFQITLGEQTFKGWVSILN